MNRSRTLDDAVSVYYTPDIWDPQDDVDIPQTWIVWAHSVHTGLTHEEMRDLVPEVWESDCVVENGESGLFEAECCTQELAEEVAGRLRAALIRQRATV